MRWYLRRPGISPHSCFVAIHDDKVVANLFVTIQEARLGGQLLKFGIIDSVMTHPAYRRQGLAKRLMREAISFMNREKVDISLLYTTPGKIPFRIYSSLGYQDYLRVNYYVREGVGISTEERSDKVIEFRGNDKSELLALINRYYSDFDGYPVIDEELWNWRKENRPTCSPARVYYIKERGRIEGTSTICEADIITGEGIERMSILTDIAFESDRSRLLGFLLSRISSDYPVVILSAVVNERDNRLYEKLNFRSIAQESAMLLPLSSLGSKVMKVGSSRWYVPTESVIGT